MRCRPELPDACEQHYRHRSTSCSPTEPFPQPRRREGVACAFTLLAIYRRWSLGPSDIAVVAIGIPVSLRRERLWPRGKRLCSRNRLLRSIAPCRKRARRKTGCLRDVLIDGLELTCCDDAFLVVVALSNVVATPRTRSCISRPGCAAHYTPHLHTSFRNSTNNGPHQHRTSTRRASSPGLDMSGLESRCAAPTDSRDCHTSHARDAMMTAVTQQQTKVLLNLQTVGLCSIPDRQVRRDATATAPSSRSGRRRVAGSVQRDVPPARVIFDRNRESESPSLPARLRMTAPTR